MNPFVFHCPTKVNFGEHMAATASDAVKDFGGTKTLIVTDEVLAKSGVLSSATFCGAENGSVADVRVAIQMSSLPCPPARFDAK